MIIIRANNIGHHYGAQRVLGGIDWAINARSKIGLVGANGVGKSTLLRIIADEIQADEGSVYRDKEVRAGYLPQEPQMESARTVWEETLSASEEIMGLEHELRRLEARMADPDILSDETRLERTMAAYARVQGHFEQVDGYAYESKVREALQTLGLDESTYNQPLNTLSGGQKKMVGLAKLLAAGCNVLLLDEPDNHLDLRRKAYLERFIRGFDGTVIIISHDRYLLDETVTQIVEIERGHITEYDGDYSTYAIKKQLWLLEQQHKYQSQQKKIARLEETIARFELWAKISFSQRLARQARTRRMMIERMDKIDEPEMNKARMGLDLGGWRGSKKVLEITDLDKVFEAEPGQEEDNIVLAGLELLIWHGQRVGLIGPNGSGKSVLMRCVLGEHEPDGGVIKIGPSVSIGYYAQEQETLDPERTLVEEVRSVKAMYENQAVAFLGTFLFPYEMVRKKVKQLSGGERSRLQLAKLMLSNTNFLLLDEPTNNLDLPSCEVLENALDDYEGTVLVISHDRYFLDRVVDRVAEIEDGALVEYAGGYTYYREEKQKRIAQMA